MKRQKYQVNGVEYRPLLANTMADLSHGKQFPTGRFAKNAV